MAGNFALPNETYGAINSSTTTAEDTLSTKTYAFVSVVCVVMVGTILYNCLIILAFLNDSMARNPFSYYLLNLSICDLGMAMFGMSGFVWFTTSPKSRADYCPYFIFFDKMFFMGAGHTLMLISIDRLWCLFSPIHYKTVRSSKLTLAVLCGIWLYLIVLNIPHVVIDAVWFNSWVLPCNMNYGAQHTYSLIIEFVAFDFPPVFVIAGYVVVIAKLISRSRIKLLKGFRGRISDRSSITTHAVQSEAVTIPENIEVTPKIVERRDEKRIFRLFALIVLCDLVCFIPGIIFYLYAEFSGNWDDDIYLVILCLGYLNCVFNPLIYHFNMPSMQLALKKLMRVPCF